ncbi:hypothetical protein [Microcoleus sp. Pol12A5]|uniref:hypothetical protein n=1 Tax=Microcoleus sp. Pol12A5 TaxID=3055392 RepID=UPI002FD6329E
MDIDIEQRLEDLENSVSFLLTEVEGKPKLFKLIEVLKTENESLCDQRNKLIRENVELKGQLCQEKFLVKKLRSIVEDEKNSVVLFKLASIVDLLNQAESQADSLISNFTIY